VKRYEVNYGICQNWYNHTYRSCILEIKKYYGNNIPKSELPGCISDDFTHSNQEQKEYFLKRIAEIIQWEENNLLNLVAINNAFTPAPCSSQTNFSDTTLHYENNQKQYGTDTMVLEKDDLLDLYTKKKQKKKLNKSMILVLQPCLILQKKFFQRNGVTKDYVA